MNNDVPPWERQSGESEKAFAAFMKYRDEPTKTRSIAKCCTDIYGQGTSRVRVWQRWSVIWRWKVRVSAWISEQDRLAREAQIAELKAMNRRHVQIGTALQTKAIERLQHLAADMLGPQDLLRFMTEGVRLERVARGGPDIIVQQQNATKRHPDDFTDDELAAIAAGGSFVAPAAQDSEE